ncbi:MAG TPA: hypothetical protein VKG43_06065 [Acidimicrobiales bacterium]|nr:hypothetical protein [Acidimicrobiales bacterium]
MDVDPVVAEPEVVWPDTVDAEPDVDEGAAVEDVELAFEAAVVWTVAFDAATTMMAALPAAAAAAARPVARRTRRWARSRAAVVVWMLVRGDTQASW